MRRSFLEPRYHGAIPSIQIALTVMLVTLLTGCASSSRTGAPTSDGNPGVEAINLADSEDFDPDQFPDVLVDDRKEIDHDVPIALLEDRADAGLAQIVSGYRIQVFSSVDRDSALEAEDRVEQWRDNLPDDIRAEYALPDRFRVYNQFKQPLYRIRVGDFTIRTEAERVMGLMAGSFQTVFVVPDQVTVYR